jgi:hypothetical protein
MLLVVGCGGRLRKIDRIPDAGCGDGIINHSAGEECEANDLKGTTCRSLGFDEGTLSCSGDCKLVKTGCIKHCGNGKIEPEEDCEGDAGLPSCETFGYIFCNSTCKIDRNHCVTAPYQPANGALQMSPGGPTSIADLPPNGLGDLLVVVSPLLRVESSPYTLERGFISNTSKFSFDKDPIEAIGLGSDIVARNRDGSVDRYVRSASQYTVTPYPDGGCSGHLLGALSTGAIAAQSCDQSELLFLGPTLLRQPTNKGTCHLSRAAPESITCVNQTQLTSHPGPAFAATDAGELPWAPTELVSSDLDGDGDLDVAALVSGEVRLLENTSANSWVERSKFQADAGAHLNATDLDLDGRYDLVWENGSSALLRRNQGGWNFAPYESIFRGAEGASWSFSIGDVDGDGDLDLVTTRHGPTDSSTSYVLLNQVR